MPIRYGVLKGKAVDRRRGTLDSLHYQIKVMAKGVPYRVAVNVKSRIRPYDLLYWADEQFEHEITRELERLPEGYTELENTPGGMALDFIRSNLFDPVLMRPLPFDLPGADNDLNEKMDHYFAKAAASKDARLYAFGEPWGPEAQSPDRMFGFEPGQGMHNVHMNQGNARPYRKDDGVYQDGALLLHFPAENRWIGVFLAFQSQSWHTDDTTGHALGAGRTLQPPVRAEGRDEAQPTGTVDLSVAPGPAGFPPQQPGTADRGTKPGPAGISSQRSPAPEGEPLPPREGELPSSARPDPFPGPVYLAGARVYSAGAYVRESVTLVNAGDRPVDLSGWTVANKTKAKQALSGTLHPGEFRTFELTRLPGGGLFLGEQGNLLTLLDPSGLKRHGVSYTHRQVRPGWTLRF